MHIIHKTDCHGKRPSQSSPRPLRLFEASSIEAAFVSDDADLVSSVLSRAVSDAFDYKQSSQAQISIESFVAHFTGIEGRIDGRARSGKFDKQIWKAIACKLHAVRNGHFLHGDKLVWLIDDEGPHVAFKIKVPDLLKIARSSNGAPSHEMWWRVCRLLREKGYLKYWQRRTKMVDAKTSHEYFETETYLAIDWDRVFAWISTSNRRAPGQENHRNCESSTTPGGPGVPRSIYSSSPDSSSHHPGDENTHPDSKIAHGELSNCTKSQYSESAPGADVGELVALEKETKSEERTNRIEAPAASMKCWIYQAKYDEPSDGHDDAISPVEIDYNPEEGDLPWADQLYCCHHRVLHLELETRKILAELNFLFGAHMGSSGFRVTNGMIVMIRRLQHPRLKQHVLTSNKLREFRESAESECLGLPDWIRNFEQSDEKDPAFEEPSTLWQRFLTPGWWISVSRKINEAKQEGACGQELFIRSAGELGLDSFGKQRPQEDQFSLAPIDELPANFQRSLDQLASAPDTYWRRIKQDFLSGQQLWPSLLLYAIKHNWNPIVTDGLKLRTRRFFTSGPSQGVFFLKTQKVIDWVGLTGMSDYTQRSVVTKAYVEIHRLQWLIKDLNANRFDFVTPRKEGVSSDNESRDRGGYLPRE